VERKAKAAAKAVERKAKQAAKWAKEKAKKAAEAVKRGLMKMFEPIKKKYNQLKNMATGFIKMMKEVVKNPKQLLVFCHGEFHASLSTNLKNSGLKIAVALIMFGKNVSLKLQLDFGNLIKSAKNSFGSILAALKKIFMGGAPKGRAKCIEPKWDKRPKTPARMGKAKPPSPKQIKGSMGKKGATKPKKGVKSITAMTKPTGHTGEEQSYRAYMESQEAARREMRRDLAQEAHEEL
jgi:hypothetical protein